MKELNNLKSKVQEVILERDGSIEYIENLSTKHEAEVLENGAPKKDSKQNERTEVKKNRRKKTEGDQTEEEHLQQRYDEEKWLKGELNQKKYFITCFMHSHFPLER